MDKHFEPTFQSLRQYTVPEWFKDAKFGIWSHWGPQSVPMFGDWYARNMYIEGTPQYEYHLRHYGRTISGDVYYALPHGPVPMDAMNVVEGKPTNLADGSEGVTYIRKCKRYNITSLAAPKMDVFSVSDKEALDCVIETYGKKTWTELSDFSHTFPEWKEYESKLGNPYLKKGYPIDMILFFENRPKEDAIFREPKELLELSKELYLESA